MEAIFTPAVALLGIFVFAFGAAWFIPLVTANAERMREQEGANEPIHAATLFLDSLLILCDSIPVFWILRVFHSNKGATSAARDKWKNEISIRRCFYLWLTSTSLLIAALMIASLVIAH